MAKRKNTEEGAQAPVVLEPVSVEEADTPKAKETQVNVPPGHVYIVALDNDGIEKEHSGFFYPEKSYKRFYGDETKYTVKKKHNKHS